MCGMMDQQRRVAILEKVASSIKLADAFSRMVSRKLEIAGEHALAADVKWGKVTPGSVLDRLGLRAQADGMGIGLANGSRYTADSESAVHSARHFDNEFGGYHAGEAAKKAIRERDEKLFGEFGSTSGRDYAERKSKIVAENFRHFDPMHRLHLPPKGLAVVDPAAARVTEPKRHVLFRGGAAPQVGTRPRDTDKYLFVTRHPEIAARYALTPSGYGRAVERGGQNLVAMRARGLTRAGETAVNPQSGEKIFSDLKGLHTDPHQRYNRSGERLIPTYQDVIKINPKRPPRILGQYLVEANKYRSADFRPVTTVKTISGHPFEDFLKD